jgi:hypothetical protein
MLVFGFAFSGAGVGLAVTGVTSDGQSAANVQYPAPVATPGPSSNPTPATPPAPNTPAPTLEPETEVIGETDESPKGDKAPEAEAAAPVEETRQLGAEAGGEELPFTGFAAIPVLLLGFALLTSGFVLRRGNGRSGD